MIRETSEAVSLSVKEMEEAIKAYVTRAGFKVPSYARVYGLEDLSGDKAVRVSISQSSNVVKT